jgi:hypothetical protein
MFAWVTAGFVAPGVSLGSAYASEGPARPVVAALPAVDEAAVVLPVFELGFFFVCF